MGKAQRRKPYRRDHRTHHSVRCPSWKAGMPEHVARARLQEIAADTRPSKVKPVRVYHCDLCGLWHLTSKRL